MRGREILTFVCPSYNNARYLRQCFDSILMQTTDRWRLLIGDDASTDESRLVYAEYTKDPRIRVVCNQKNLGVVPTVAGLIERAQTDLVGIVDSDDGLEPTCLERVLSVYDRDPEAAFVYTNFWICDDQLRPQRRGFCRALAPRSTALDEDCVSHFKSFRRSMYQELGGLDLDLAQAEDKDLVFKFEERTKLHFVDDCLYRYRVRKHSTSHQNRAETRAWCREVQRRTRLRRLQNGASMGWKQALLARLDNVLRARGRLPTLTRK